MKSVCFTHKIAWKIFELPLPLTLNSIGSDRRFGAGQATSHYLNQWWNIMNCTPGNQFQCNRKRNLYNFIQENTFKNVIWKIPFLCLGLNVLTIDVLCGNDYNQLRLYTITNVSSNNDTKTIEDQTKWPSFFWMNMYLFRFKFYLRVFLRAK